MRERNFPKPPQLLNDQRLRLSDSLRAIRKYRDVVGLLEELSSFPRDISNDFGICALVATTALFGPESIHLSDAARIKHIEEFSATVDRIVKDMQWEVIKPRSSHEFTALLSGNVHGALLITDTKKPEVGHAIGIIPLWKISEEKTHHGMQFCSIREFFVFDTTSKSGIDVIASEKDLVDIYCSALFVEPRFERAVFVFRDYDAMIDGAI